MKKLHALTLPTLPVGDHPDHLTDGLIFKVGHRLKSWCLRTRVGGVRKRIMLGYYPAIGLAEARSAARKAMERIETGAPAIPEPVVHPRHEPTLGSMIDQYEKVRRREGQIGKSFDHGLHT